MQLPWLNISWKSASPTLSIDQVIARLESVTQASSGVSVTPENCMQSPTVQAIVQAVTRRMATLPVHVMQKTTKKGRTVREPLPNHPAVRLLNSPNDWQTRTSYWLDAVSWVLRYGNYYAHKGRGQTGPIRRLVPLMPNAVTVLQDDETMDVTYRVQLAGGRNRDYPASEIHHVRGPARNGLVGDSIVHDMREAIALEIAAERMGGSMFGNNAQPGMVFEFQEGTAGFKNDEERKKFVEGFEAVYRAAGRFKSMLLPKGIKMGAQVGIENEKAQFLATRQYQRTVIAGAWGVPPHLVGDLTKMTFGNVEQQSLDFIQSVVLPVCQIFEAAMERDLLTRDDRASGVQIRFNLDAALRGDFKTRQDGLNIQRAAGVINANEWRELEGKNPISDDDGGEEYWRQGSSGQSAAVPGKPGAPAKPEDDDEIEDDATEKELEDATA